jgi:hypothetical protein
MDVALRCVFCLQSILVNAGATQTAVAPPDKLAQFKDPKTTYLSYIEATRKNDVKAATRCWVIDDDNKSGALDTVVGLWISMRRINQVAENKFGMEGLDGTLKGWRRDDVNDAALALTEKRVEDAEVKISGEIAEMKIKWKDGDGVPNPAFSFGEDPIFFRKVNGSWKIDFHKMTGLKHAADFFEKGTWGPMFRDQVVIMNAAVEGMEKGKLKSAKELGEFVDGEMKAMEKKYEEERKKEPPKGK